MYRNADQVLEERRAELVERAARQLEAFTPEDLHSLPHEMKQRLAALETRLTPEGLAPAAIADAEAALADREELLKEARALIRHRRKRERRARYDRALGTIRSRGRVGAALMLLGFLAVVLGVGYG